MFKPIVNCANLLSSQSLLCRVTINPIGSIKVRHVGKTLGARRNFVRKPIKVYSPSGEEILSQEKLNPRKVDSTDTSSVALFSKIMSGINNNRNRKRIALEGYRLVQEALNTDVKLEFLFVANSVKNLPEDLKTNLEPATKIHRVSDEQFKLWSSLTTSPGLIGVCPKLSKYREVNFENRLPLSVVCDNIRDPGNLGSILRSSAAAGCGEAILSKGCVDPWDSKVLRGGSGAHFYLPIISDISLDSIGNYLVQNTSAHVLPENSSDKIKNRVAVFIADNNVSASRSELPIPTIGYSDVDYTQFGKIYLVIGGETEGLSDHTLKLAQSVQFPPDVFITRVNIPLYNNFDSLNAAHACSVIIFEIARQFRTSRSN